MDILKITIKGDFAFFKKPDVNTFMYFTYENIHKIVLMGIFGSILGYKGYSQMSFENKYKKEFPSLEHENGNIYPQFYEKLNKIKIGIVPKNVTNSKKVQVFNNSVGYASKELGGNLIVKEQWLENPSWDIYILLDNPESENIAKAIMNKETVFIPYLGKNDHLANIENPELIKNAKNLKEVNKIHSLFKKKDFEIVVDDDDFEDENSLNQEIIPIFKYEEKLPIELDETTNNYKFESFQYTNETLKIIKSPEIYRVENKNIVFI